MTSRLCQTRSFFGAYQNNTPLSFCIAIFYLVIEPVSWNFSWLTASLLMALRYRVKCIWSTIVPTQSQCSVANSNLFFSLEEGKLYIPLIIRFWILMGALILSFYADSVRKALYASAYNVNKLLKKNSNCFKSLLGFFQFAEMSSEFVTDFRPGIFWTKYEPFI